MSKLYTKTGDDGTSSLYDGSRTQKSDSIFETLGLLDELSVYIGVTITHLDKDLHDEVIHYLRKLQVYIIDISSIIATPSKDMSKNLSEYIPIECEKEIDEYSKRCPPLTEFVLTGVSVCDAFINVCRVLTRKVERNLWMNKYKHSPDFVLIFLNRLSDYFFAVGRWLTPTELKVSQVRKEL